MDTPAPTSAGTVGVADPGQCRATIAAAADRGDYSTRGIAQALAARVPVSPSAPGPTKAAVALILRDGPAGAELLFIERAIRAGDPWSGHVGLPGGRWEVADPDLAATAAREAHEEVDLELARVGACLGPLPAVIATGRGTAHELTIAPYVFLVGGVQPRAAGAEVAAMFWVALADLARVAPETRVELTVAGERRSLPAWTVGERVIWGLTHDLVHHLLVAIGARAPVGA